MALTATVYTARLQLADQDRGLYRDFHLKLALHPSEQPERLVARLLAWCLNADDALRFSRGLSASEEPDIWQHDDAGNVTRWIEVGEPDADRLRKTSHRAADVQVFGYTRSLPVWWKKHGRDIERLHRVSVFALPPTAVAALAAGLARQFQWQVTVSERTLYVATDHGLIEVPAEPLTGH